MAAAQALDGEVVRRWIVLSAAALGSARAWIDDMNVFPVPDADTGTNLHRTMTCAAQAVAALPEQASAADVWQAATTAALTGACGNSGIILSQLLRGLADGCAGAAVCDGLVLAGALGNAAALARAAVRHPVEGTVLTVADAAARAASASVACLADAALAAAEAARKALEGTTRQLDVLAARGVVDAGGAGLCVLLDALSAAVTGAEPPADRLPVLKSLAAASIRIGPPESSANEPGSNAYEVTFLLEADERNVAQLADLLDELGDSLVLAGGAGKGSQGQRRGIGRWHVHVHVADAGAVIDHALAAGRPERITVTYLAALPDVPLPAAAGPAETQNHRAVVIAEGAALSGLLRDAGALVVETDSMVQSIAAVAVHDPDRDPAADAATMARAVAAMRTGSVEFARVAEHRGERLTGLVGGQVVARGNDAADVVSAVLAVLLRPDTELVTLVRGAAAEPGLDTYSAEVVRGISPQADVTCYDGGMADAILLIGAE